MLAHYQSIEIYFHIHSVAVVVFCVYLFICLFVVFLFVFSFSCEVQISLRNTFNTLDAARLFESPPSKPNCLRMHQP